MPTKSRTHLVITLFAIIYVNRYIISLLIRILTTLTLWFTVTSIQDDYSQQGEDNIKRMDMRNRK